MIGIEDGAPNRSTPKNIMTYTEPSTSTAEAGFASSFAEARNASQEQRTEPSRYDHLGIKVHRRNPSFLSDLSKALLHDGDYVREGESIPQALARPAVNFCFGDYELAQRIYDYAHKGWFMYASPVLSNATPGTWYEDPTKEGKDYWHRQTFIPKAKPQGQPISCFAFDVPDNLEDQEKTIIELARLSTSGGGTGAHNSIRATSRKAPGPIPYEKVLDGAIGYFKQKGTRKGALAYYMDSKHPSIKEHVRFRVPGGDSKRRSDNRTQFHTGVNLTDELIRKILGIDKDDNYELRCPHTDELHETVSARHLWEEMLETRALTGEPFFTKIDRINFLMPETQKLLGLKIKGSNLCTEITLPTDKLRTFVCCLSSLNLDKFAEWKNSKIVEDLIRFLDNVLQWFIDTAPEAMAKARYSAMQERALGLGAFGWHSYLQQNKIPFESGGFNSAVSHTHRIFSLIKSRAEAESLRLGAERGEAPDMRGTGRRNSRLMAIAPNANSADIANVSPSCEPWYRNVFMKDTRAGAYTCKNPYLERDLEEIGLNTKAIWKSIADKDGSVQHLEIPEDMKRLYKTAMELDQHWVVTMANERGGHVCQAQSTNLFFPPGSLRAYVNSVHLLFLKLPNVLTLYYLRSERETKVDNAREIQRKALVDWQGDDCKSCQG